jgi:hypothetical protein
VTTVMMMINRMISIKRDLMMSTVRMNEGGRPALIGLRLTLMMSMMKTITKGCLKEDSLEVGPEVLQDCSLSKRAMTVDLPIWKLGLRFTCQNSL